MQKAGLQCRKQAHNNDNTITCMIFFFIMKQSGQTNRPGARIARQPQSAPKPRMRTHIYIDEKRIYMSMQGQPTRKPSHVAPHCSSRCPVCCSSPLCGSLFLPCCLIFLARRFSFPPYPVSAIVSDSKPARTGSPPCKPVDLGEPTAAVSSVSLPTTIITVVVGKVSPVASPWTSRLEPRRVISPNLHEKVS